MINIVIRHVAKRYPDIIPLLTGKARAFAFSCNAVEYKSFDTMKTFIAELVKDTYIGRIGTIDFADEMSRVITGEFIDAYKAAWRDSDVEGEPPYWFENSLETFTTSAIDMEWIYAFFKDIMQARKDKTPLLPLLERATLWANRWNDAYNEAMRVIAVNMGQKLKWVEGDTADKCEVCVALNGIVAYASVWEELGVKPQSAPNPNLTCGGWRCGCYFQVTNQKQTRDARGAILAAIGW